MPACDPVVEQTRVESPHGQPSLTLLPAGDDSTPVLAHWTIEDDRAVVGSLEMQNACIVRALQPMQQTEVTTTSPNPGNVFWLVTGLAMIGGGVAATVIAAKTDSAGIGATGLTTGIVGLWPTFGSLGALGKDTTTSQRAVATTERETLGTVKVSCGPRGALEGAHLTLRAPGLPARLARVDDLGHARFELPEDAGVDPSARATISIADVPTAVAAFVKPGTVLGEVNLSSYARAVAARRAAGDAASRQADALDFEGVIHGDDVAKQAFSLACTPTGEDVCFDAIDNDCDGLYDVGCGYQSGALQWTLAWKTGDDLDLHVIGPDGVEVFFGHRKGGSAGLALDVDCLGQFGSNCLAGNVENIFTPRDKKPVEGTYRGWVVVFRAANDDSDPGRVIDAMLGGRVAGKAFRIPITLAAQRFVRTSFAFAVGKDRDKDSVIDREDACPDQPGVFSAYPTENGCPDRDMDGVADRFDACPDEVGIRSASMRDNGCPRKFGKAWLTDRGVHITEAIHFGSGSAVISPQSFPLLRDVATVMRAAPSQLQEVRIEGHTDSDGDAPRNRKLSFDRVRSVYEHLVRHEHIPTATLSLAWFGPDRPVASNATEQGKALNRRVEFRVVKPAPRAVLSW
jgi:outer membrane protein OmpA-like peptidoglycan-associated protein